MIKDNPIQTEKRLHSLLVCTEHVEWQELQLFELRVVEDPAHAYNYVVIHSIHSTRIHSYPAVSAIALDNLFLLPDLPPLRVCNMSVTLSALSSPYTLFLRVSVVTCNAQHQASLVLSKILVSKSKW